MGTEAFLERPWLGIASNLPAMLGAAGILLLLWPRFRHQLERGGPVPLVITFLLTRPLFLLFVLGAFGHVSSDLTNFFATQAGAVRAGDLPYLDFVSSYAPLFPYLLALPLLAGIGSEAAAILSFFVLCDGAVIFLLGRLDTDRAVVARARWLATTAPVTWYFLVRYAQDEVLTALFLVMAALFLRRRPLIAGLILGLGFAATKMTFAVFVPPFLILSARRSRTILGLGLAVSAAFVPFLLAKAPVWQPWITESGSLGAGPSIWRLPVVFTTLTLETWSILPLGLALAALWTRWTLQGPRAPDLSLQLTATGLVFLILSPKMLPMYAAPFWPFMALWLARRPDRLRINLAAVFTLLLTTWWYWDAGGIQGGFGPAAQAAAVLWTGLIPLAAATFLALGHGDASQPRPAGNSA